MSKKFEFCYKNHKGTFETHVRINFSVSKFDQALFFLGIFFLIQCILKRKFAGQWKNTFL